MTIKHTLTILAVLGAMGVKGQKRERIDWSRYTVSGKIDTVLTDKGRLYLDSFKRGLIRPESKYKIWYYTPRAVCPMHPNWYLIHCPFKHSHINTLNTK